MNSTAQIHLKTNIQRLSALVLLVLVCQGCGASQRGADHGLTPGEADARRFEMEPILVAGKEGKDGSVSSRVFDARELFHTGQTAFEKKAFEACDEAYGELIARFPQSKYFQSALYNRGLCAEGLKAHLRAIELFDAHIQGAKTLEDQRDGEIRKGFNLIEAEQYGAALELYDKLLEAKDLGLLDRAECFLRKGVALNRSKKRVEAERSLEAAKNFVRQGADGIVQGNDLFAEAHFRRGEIYQDMCHEIQLKLPLETMKTDLEEKVRLFRQSQRSYLDALNVRESYWATASGMKLGELYEQFYDDVVAAQFPEEFDESTRGVYFSELQEQLQPLLEQSLSIYEKNLSMSLRLGTENEWVRETQKRLMRLKQILEENAEANLEKNEVQTASEAAVTDQGKETRQ